MSDQKIELSTSDVVNALLHARQSEHHYATQESVDNQFDKMNATIAFLDKKIERLQWFVVTSVVLIAIFKDNILNFLA